MSDDRRRAMGQLMASETEPVNTTIVGGQPPRQQGKTVKVPAGVERALYMAATDAGFREELLVERDAATTRLGLSLSGSERAMLRGASRSQLEAIIDGLDVSADNLRRRRFLQAVAVGVAAVAAGCGDDDGKTDAPVSGPDATGILSDMPVSAGLQPDLEAPEAGPTMDGIRPDGS